MRRLSSITLALSLLMLGWAQQASGQWNVARFGESAQRNRVYTSFGLDPAFVTSVGYGRVVLVSGHAFQLSGDVGLVAARIDVRDFRTRLGMKTSIVSWRSFGLTGNATFISRGTENSIYRAFDFGADFTGELGVYRPRWFAAGEFGFDKAIITHLTHSDWYRTYGYADAKDGWYLNAGGTYHHGLIGGLSMGRSELVVRAGWHKTERFNSLASPVYGSIGLGYAL